MNEQQNVFVDFKSKYQLVNSFLALLYKIKMKTLEFTSAKGIEYKCKNSSYQKRWARQKK